MKLRLKITNLRVERLQEISEEDSGDEGVMVKHQVAFHDYLNPDNGYLFAKKPNDKRL